MILSFDEETEWIFFCMADIEGRVMGGFHEDISCIGIL